MEEFQGFGIEVFDLWVDISNGNEINPELIKEKYNTYITQPLIESGKLKMTIPGKPKSKDQKYYKA